MRLSRSLICFRKTILPVCDKIQHVHCFLCFLHLRRFPSHIITYASLTLQTSVFSSEVFMEGGTDNPSAHRNCAGTIPSSVTYPHRRTSCWANTGVEEARLRPRCCSKFFRVSLVFEFQLIFHFCRHIQLLLILSTLLMDNSRYLSNLTCRLVLEPTLEAAEKYTYNAFSNV